MVGRGWDETTHERIIKVMQHKYRFIIYFSLSHLSHLSIYLLLLLHNPLYSMGYGERKIPLFVMRRDETTYFCRFQTDSSGLCCITSSSHDETTGETTLDSFMYLQHAQITWEQIRKTNQFDSLFGVVKKSGTPTNRKGGRCGRVAAFCKSSEPEAPTPT